MGPIIHFESIDTLCHVTCHVNHIESKKIQAHFLGVAEGIPQPLTSDGEISDQVPVLCVDNNYIMCIVRNQGNLTPSYRPNSGGIKENQSKPMVCSRVLKLNQWMYSLKETNQNTGF